MMEIHPNFLKLDRKLMHGCNHHTLRQVLIQSLLESAHKMGIRVVAEGLEDPEDIQFCRNLGIDLAQGFGLAKPSTTLLAV
jgi:EAL domain-containing protein (putative c-di-GMP-specific phosphodiesterase class I)